MFFVFSIVIARQIRFRDSPPNPRQESKETYFSCRLGPAWERARVLLRHVVTGEVTQQLPLLPNMADTRLYEILGVSPNANDTEIKKVRRKAL